MKRTTKILLGVVVFLIALPFIVLHYVNKALAEDLAGYYGHVDDVDLALYRGAYRIIDMRVEQVDNDVREPFLYVPAIDFSVEWKSIFDGAFTGEVMVERPEVTFAFGATAAQTQTGEAVDWVAVVTDLMPITINRFAVGRGTASHENAWAEPRVDLELHAINIDLRNIRNVVGADSTLPSPFDATAEFPGYGGHFSASGHAQLLKDVPDFDYDARLEGLQLTEMNDLMKYYSGLDFERGTASVYSEIAMANGTFDGYVKPILTDVQIFARKEGDRSVGQWFKELFAQGASELIENHRRDEIASVFPIEGTVDDTHTGVYTAIISVLRNAYFRALRPTVDETIDFEDALAAGRGGDNQGGFLKKVFGGRSDETDPTDGAATRDTTEKRGLVKRIFGGKEPDER